MPAASDMTGGRDLLGLAATGALTLARQLEAGELAANSTRPAEERSEPRLGVITNSYYDFLINEGSYKFWAIFQLVTVAILLYSTFAAVYYAKYTFLQEVNNSDVDDFFLRRSGRAARRRRRRRLFLGLDPPTYQRIVDAVSTSPAR